VEGLPNQVAMKVRAQLLPAVGAAQAAERAGDRAAAGAALRTLIGGVWEFRLHVPLDTQVALASQAQCIIDALGASAS
jgi:hypothetical protein